MVMDNQSVKGSSHWSQMAEHAWSDQEKQEALSTGEMEPARVLANGKQQAVENIWGGSSLAGPAQGDVNVGLLPLSAVLSWYLDARGIGKWS